MRELNIVTLIVGMGLLVGCTSGVGLDLGPGPVPETPGGSSLLAASFTAQEPAPGALSVSLAESGTAGALVTVQVNVTGTDELYGASFELLYDPDHVEFQNHSPGTVLETGGNTPLYTVAALADRLSIGVTRSGPVPGVDVGTTQTLVLLTFRVLEPGNSLATLESGVLLDAGPPAPQAIDGISWFGGQFNGN